jgi:hypothetical protein
MGTNIETLQRMSRRQQWHERPDERTDSLQRAWRDVNKARVVFGLGLAPIFPSAISWTWTGLTTDNVDIDDFIFTSIVSTGLGMCWCIGVGSLFLLWLGRTYGLVGRFNCLALCGTLTFSMPLVTSLIAFSTGPHRSITENVGTILGSAVIGLGLAPLGIFGGWVLWRIAIRPAAVPVQEMAEIF